MTDDDFKCLSKPTVADLARRSSNPSFDADWQTKVWQRIEHGTAIREHRRDMLCLLGVVIGTLMFVAGVSYYLWMVP